MSAQTSIEAHKKAEHIEHTGGTNRTDNDVALLVTFDQAIEGVIRKKDVIQTCSLSYNHQKQPSNLRHWEETSRSAMWASLPTPP